MTLIAALTIGTTGLIGIAAKGDDAAQPSAPTKSTLLAVSSAVYEPPCTDAQQGITYYRKAYTASREKMRLAGAVPRVWYHDCQVIRRRATEWRDRAKTARLELRKWIDYHYNWRSWLPRNWYVTGSCETGYGGAPNFNHANSSFVSAFGISRRIYDYDARLAGMPPWNDRQPPTPRQQLLTAIAHYNHFGDGWTCPGP